MPLELEISGFDPSILEKKRLNGRAPVILFIGSRGTGKSSCVIDILSYFNKDIPFVVMSGTEAANGAYSNYIHEACIYPDFNKDVVEAIIENQKRLGAEYKQKGEDFKKHPEHGVGILLDDLSYDKSIMKQQCLRELALNGRHQNCVLILTFQYAMDIPCVFRENADFIFIASQNKKDSIDKLYKYFCSYFDKVSDFKKVLNKCTENYGQLVVDNTSTSKRIEDCVFWYRADINKSFKVCPKQWSIWDRQLKKDNEDNGKTFQRPLGESDIVVKIKPSRKMDFD